MTSHSLELRLTKPELVFSRRYKTNNTVGPFRFQEERVKKELKTHNLRKRIDSINLRKLKKPAALCISVLFIISIFATFTAHASPTFIFSSGFEDGFNSWTATSGSVSIVSSPVYSGSYAMKCSDSYGSTATVYLGTQIETYTEAQFCFSQDVAGSQTLIAYFNDAGTPTVSLGISVQGGRAYLFVEDKLPSNSYAQYPLSGVVPGTWYSFALDASASSASIFVNGAQVAGVSQPNIPATATMRIGIFWGDCVYTGNLYIDNVQVASASGSTSSSTSTPTAPPSTSTSVSAGQYVSYSVGTQIETYTEAQFCFSQDVAGSQTLIAYFNDAGTPTVSLGISVQGGRAYLFVEDKLPSNSYAQYPLSGVVPGTWYSFALDASASSASIFVNGAQVASVSQPNIPATAIVHVGLFWGDGTYAGTLLLNSIQVGSSSGSTSSSTPTPAPTATPTPTPTPTYSGNSLPLTGFADDYLTWVNWNGDPSYWSSQLHWFTEFHCNTARLCFTFADDPGAGTLSADSDSTYTYAKMNTVLNLLSSVGVKPILCDFSDRNGNWYGSAAWINDWKNLASSFAGDSRIRAFEIANEPYTYACASNAQTMSTFNSACQSLITQVRAIDPTRTIMMPCEVGIITGSPTAYYNDLVANGIMADGNLLFDIVHPYYFERYPSMDPVNNPLGDAEYYWNAYCLPQISYFGASNCYAGETYPWSRYDIVPGTSQYYNYALQQQFEIAMINHFVSAGMGFQILCFFSTTDQQADIDALTNSNYYSLING